jgi:sugar (pentulose or hexulose) kinase
VGAVYALDVGTSSVRAAVVLPDGTVAASARIERPDGEGAERFDAELLWDTTVAILRELTCTPGVPVGDALAVTAHIGTVFLDARDRVVGEPGGWSDRRGVDDPVWMPSADQLARLGRPVLTGGALPALLAMRAADPAVARGIAHILSPKDLLVLRLTGERVTDLTSAGYTLAFDVRQRSWEEELLGELGVDPTVFPAPSAGDQPVGPLRAEVAAATGLSAGIPVVHGGPDGSIAQYGILGGSWAAIADVAGTTDVLGRRTAVASARFPRAVLNVAPDGRGYVVGGPTGYTGGAAGWWAEKLGFADVADALAADARPPGPSGILVQPALTGSRFPHWDPTARGAIARDAGADPATTMRAVQEGIAFTVRAGLEAMTGADESLPLALAGGSARSARVAQLRADVLGRAVIAVRDPDAGLRGSAMLAGAPIAALVDDADAPRFEPDAGVAAAYDAAYAEWSAWVSSGCPA